MSQRQANLLWMKDLLADLERCRQQLSWAEDAQSVFMLSERMVRDLDRCRRLCEELNRRSQPQGAV